MKKFIIFLEIILLVTGCGKTINKLDLKKTKDIIEESLKDMKDIEDDSLTDVYGLDLNLMEEHVFKLNDNVDLYAIIKTKEKAKVKNEMTKYFEKVQKFNTNYSPERIEILNNRVEKEIGDYLIYIVAKNADTIYKSIIDSM